MNGLGYRHKRSGEKGNGNGSRSIAVPVGSVIGGTFIAAAAAATAAALELLLLLFAGFVLVAGPGGGGPSSCGRATAVRKRLLRCTAF